MTESKAGLSCLGIQLHERVTYLEQELPAKRGRPTVETLSSQGLGQPRRRRVEVLVSGDDLPALDAGNHATGEIATNPSTPIAGPPVWLS